MHPHDARPTSSPARRWWSRTRWLARWTSISISEPLGNDRKGQPVFLRDIWPTSAEVRDVVASVVEREVVPRALPRRVQGERAVERHRGHELATCIDWNEDSTYIREPSFFDGVRESAVAHCAHHRRARARMARRLRDHRPHFARRIHLAEVTGGASIYGARCAAQGFQFLRRATRQPRSHDARHLRQHSPAQPARARLRGRRGPSTFSMASEMSDLRRRVEYQAAGVALIVLAGKEYGSGSSRDWAAKGRAPRRARRDRGILRAHPPQQPGWHGRAAAAIHGRRTPRTQRRRDFRDSRSLTRSEDGCDRTRESDAVVGGTAKEFKPASASTRRSKSSTTATVGFCRRYLGDWQSSCLDGCKEMETP